LLQYFQPKEHTRARGSQPPEDLQHRLTNKNAPHGREAFGAENETRTISCNMLIISDLKETEKTLGET
ncbi:MAG: hypothetical protein IIT86_12355, partial [Oscillospiraceae bacterium]|nr:hypothetical protein [Oscillospiraceae bacterium]